MVAKTKTEAEAPEGETGKELVEQKAGTTDMAVYEGYEADRGAGYENQSSDDISVPFIEILQAQSPEVQVDDGPRAGTLINRTTGEIWPGKDGVSFIPSTTSHELVEWVPREKGGGLVASYSMNPGSTDPFAENIRKTQPLGKYTNPDNGNDLIETFYVYGIFVEGDQSHPAVLAFSSSRIKDYKDWMFRARAIVITLPNGRKLTKLPLFSHRYRLMTAAKENSQGKWFGFQVRFDGENAESSRIAPNDDLYTMAKQLNEDVSAGRKTADTSSAGTRDEVVDGAPAKGDTTGADAPY